MSDFQNMTVAALREFAKERGIKLSKSLVKKEIIELLEEAVKDEEFAKPKADSLEEKTTEDSDTTVVPPIKSGPHNDIVYSIKPAWQAKPLGVRAPATVTSMPVSRFGPTATPATTRFGPAATVASKEEQGKTTDRSKAEASHSQQRAATPLASSQALNYGGGRVMPKTIASPSPSFQTLSNLDSLFDGQGILEVLPDGFGFLRDETFTSTSKDIYVSNAQIKRFSLRTGDRIEGKVRPQKDGEKYSALLYITTINGISAEEQSIGNEFYSLEATYSEKLIPLKESTSESDFGKLFAFSSYFAPIGYGQRAIFTFEDNQFKEGGMVHLPDCFDIAEQDNCCLLGVFFAQTPEGANQVKKDFKGETLVSTFDQSPDTHVRMAELALGRALRMAEQGKDVIMVIDDIGALTNAYQALSLQNVRGSVTALSPSALTRTLRFFGVARKLAQRGSITAIASYYLREEELSRHLHNELLSVSNSYVYFRFNSISQRLYLDCRKGDTRNKEQLIDQNTRDFAFNLRTKFSKKKEQENLCYEISSLVLDTKTIEEMNTVIYRWLNK